MLSTHLSLHITSYNVMSHMSHIRIYYIAIEIYFPFNTKIKIFYIKVVKSNHLNNYKIY